MSLHSKTSFTITLDNNNYNQAGATKSATFHLPVLQSEIDKALYSANDFNYSKNPVTHFNPPIITAYDLPMRIDMATQLIEKLNTFIMYLQQNLNSNIFDYINDPSTLRAKNSHMNTLFALVKNFDKHDIIEDIIPIYDVLEHIESLIRHSKKSFEKAPIEVLSEITHYTRNLNINQLQDGSQFAEKANSMDKHKTHFDSYDKQYYSYYHKNSSSGDLLSLSPYHVNTYIEKILRSILIDINTGYNKGE